MFSYACSMIFSHMISFLLSCYFRARSVDVDTIIESIFSTTGDARLPQPVPLSQMIDLLVDFWEVRFGNRGRRGRTERGSHVKRNLFLLIVSPRPHIPFCRRTGFMTNPRREEVGKQGGAGGGGRQECSGQGCLICIARKRGTERDEGGSMGRGVTCKGRQKCK